MGSIMAAQGYTQRLVEIVTVSKRVGWEQLAIESLDKQTYYNKYKRNFRWIIVTEEPNEKLQAFIDLCGPSKIKPLLLQAPKKKEGCLSNLNASLNWGLKHTSPTASHIVFYQDFIELEEDTLEKLVKNRNELSKSFITTATHENGKFDARYTGTDTLRTIEPREWEANVAIAPRQALFNLGGFDEEYDQGWSWDNVNVAERAALLGYKFYIDESIQPNLHFHEKERSIPPNGEFHEQRMRETRHLQRPIKLDYL